jgi:hypothetical protein
MSDNNHGSIVSQNNEDSASGGSGSCASLNNDSDNSNSSSNSSEDTRNAKKRKLFEKSEKLHLTLENFDSDDIPSDYPYVLTSPRSLAACRHFSVRVSHFQESLIVSTCTTNRNFNCNWPNVKCPSFVNLGFPHFWLNMFRYN